MTAIKEKKKYNQLEIKEKMQKMNEKFKEMDQKIAITHEKKRIKSLMHQEMDNLRLSDVQELRIDNINKGQKDKYDIIEKHIGLAASLSEKKQQI